MSYMGIEFEFVSRKWVILRNCKIVTFWWWALNEIKSGFTLSIFDIWEINVAVSADKKSSHHQLLLSIELLAETPKSTGKLKFLICQEMRENINSPYQEKGILSDFLTTVIPDF